MQIQSQYSKPMEAEFNMRKEFSNTKYNNIKKKKNHLDKFILDFSPLALVSTGHFDDIGVFVGGISMMCDLIVDFILIWL